MTTARHAVLSPQELYELELALAQLEQRINLAAGKCRLVSADLDALARRVTEFNAARLVRDAFDVLGRPE